MNKTILFTLFSAVIFLFSACGDDNDSTTANTAAVGRIILGEENNATFDSLFSLKASYILTDGNGKTLIDTLDLASAELIGALTCPCTLVFKYSCVAKSDIKVLQNMTYDFEFNPQVSLYSNKGTSQRFDNQTTISCMGSEIVSKFEEFNKETHEVTYKIAYDGTITRLSSGMIIDSGDDVK